MEQPIGQKIYGAMPISNIGFFEATLQKYGFKEDTPVSVLPFAGAIGKEIRHLYYQLAVGGDGLFRTEPVLTDTPKGEKILHHLQVTRLFSFGACNAFCPYCKRDMQFIDDDGNVIASETTAIRNLFEMAEGAVARGEVVRFSGGDPVLYPKVCQAIGEYVEAIGGKGVSIAHNGSRPLFVERLLPLMSSAAIDIKGPRRFMGTILGLNEKQGEIHYRNSLKSQAIFHQEGKNPKGALLDVRTPVFGSLPDPNVPQTTLEDMLALGKDITETNDPRRTFWTWRLYKSVKGCNWNPPVLEEVLDMMEQVSKVYPKQWMGIRAKWHGGGMLYYYGGKCVNPAKLDVSEKAGSGNTGECITN